MDDIAINEAKRRVNGRLRVRCVRSNPGVVQRPVAKREVAVWAAESADFDELVVMVHVLNRLLLRGSRKWQLHGNQQCQSDEIVPGFHELLLIDSVCGQVSLKEPWRSAELPGFRVG